MLLAHNYYQQAGGEDQVFASESSMLRGRGHRVVEFVRDNRSIDVSGPMGQARLMSRTIWSRPARKELATLVARERPSIAHFHNTFPLISPSAYAAAREFGVPVVQTLHNYRLLCPNAIFFRDGQVCQECLGKLIPWPGVRHRCYRGSAAAGGAVAGMLAAHRLLGNWDRLVDVYIVLTEFARDQFTRGGFSADQLMVKPNFVDPDPGTGHHRGRFALFAGRLSAEKGVKTLLEAWREVGDHLPLVIAGDGPLAGEVAAMAEKLPSIRWLGRQTEAEVGKLMGEASFLIVPSTWYEGMPRVIVEAYARGTPVVASRIGALPEIVDDERTGHLFDPGNVDQLAEALLSLAHDDQRLQRLSRSARAEFEAKYTAEANYARLLEIYSAAAGRAGLS
ncbi:MAG TPA: glycosyltransferase family 4 protein [Thermomicrobiaceae bacterium]|nr:glycosyltransferase family 4 protein [Thermomicrobiaceae bacterium]